MGFREGSVPFGFMDGKSQWVGFGVDLGQEIVKPLNTHFSKEIELVRQPINPKTRIPLVINGTVDIGIGSTTIILAWEKVIDFSLPYFLTVTRIIVPKNSSIRDFPDLAGKRVVGTLLFCRPGLSDRLLDRRAFKLSPGKMQASCGIIGQANS